MFSICRLINPSQIRLINPIVRGSFNFCRGKSDTILTRLITKKYQQKLEQRSEEVKRSWTPVYTNPFILPLAFVVKLKIYHTVFSIMVTGTCFYLYTQGEISDQTLFLFSLVCFVVLALLFGYSVLYQRLVGKIYLSKDMKQARFAHLNFWGRREDSIVPIEKVIPLSDCNKNLSSFHLKVALRKSDKVYYINLKPGAFIDPEGFETIFCYRPSFVTERMLETSKSKTKEVDSKTD